jgi:dienelactone hydrolase
MKIRICLATLLLASFHASRAQQAPDPHVVYPEKVHRYLQRVQTGKQAHAFNPSADFDRWQHDARLALISLIGLEQMEKDLQTHSATVELGDTLTTEDGFTRALCSIETEPGIHIPFYLLTPLDKEGNQPHTLLLCPHGHDPLGLHSYAGVFLDEAHRKKVISKEGDIAVQAARRGFTVIAPATRGLARELEIPDPRGRHGKRPCRAQLIHCLLGGRTPIAERVWDMQRLLDWAESQEDIASDRIVMTGNSGGGVVTAYTAAIDPRITAAIPSCSFTSASSKEGYIFHCDCCLVPKLRDWGDWKELGGLMAPRHLLIVHGTGDTLHHQTTVEALAKEVQHIYKLAGVPNHMDLKWGHAGHRFYPEKMWTFIQGIRPNTSKQP